MKCLKTLAVAAVAAAALMAFAGSASATSITVTTENGTTITATAGATWTSELEAGTKATLKSSFIGEVICEKATFNGEVTNAGGAASTVSGSVTALTLTSCNGTVTVLKRGTFEVHTEGSSANGNGTLTSSGAEVTVELSGLHCIYSTSNSDAGPVTGTHGGHVIIHFTLLFGRTGGRSGAFCGSSAEFRGTFTFNFFGLAGLIYTAFTFD